MGDSEDKQYYGYLAVKVVDENELPPFAFGRRAVVDRARDVWAGNEAPEDKQAINAKVDDESDQPDFTHESTLTEALTKSIDFGLEQFQLIATSSIFSQLFRTIIAVGVVLRPCQTSSEKIEEDEILSIYGLTEEEYLDLVERTERYNQMKAGLKNIPSAIFLSLVASFDSLIVEILGKMLRLNKKWLERSQRSLPLSVLAQVDSLEQILEDAISDEIYQFSRGSHDEQAKYIESQFGVGIKDHWKRWPDYIEVFERRNLVAHGERAFNKRYIGNYILDLASCRAH